MFIEAGDYLEQKRNLTIFVTDEILRSLREKVDKAEWKTYGNAAIVNAFYDSVSNSISKFRQVFRYFISTIARVLYSCIFFIYAIC